MRKLFWLLLILWIWFFSYTFAQYNSIVVQSNYSNFKNDYYHWKPGDASIIYTLSSQSAINPFQLYLSWWYNVTWYKNSPNFSTTGTYFWVNQRPWSTNNYSLYFNPATLSVWYAFNQSYDCYRLYWISYPCFSHSAFIWFDFPDFQESFFTKVSTNITIPQYYGTEYSITQQSSYRFITPYNIQNTVYSYQWTFQPYYSTPVAWLIQKFKSDEVIWYNQQWTWSSASNAANNSQYFLGHWNAFSYITPMLNAEWVWKREDLYFWAVHNTDTFQWYWGVISESYWILLLSPNDKMTKSSDYRNTVVAISKDPADPRNLLAWIYPYCNCTTLDCIANYCTPSKVWHLIGKIDANPDLWAVTCSSTGISTLLPYADWNLGTYWTVDLDTVDNYYWWQFADSISCNPIPEYFFKYLIQKNIAFMPDVYLNWDYLCFDQSATTLNANCLKIVSSSSVSPIAWASSQYSWMHLIWSYPETYDLYWSGTTNGYIIQVQSQLEQTYWFTTANSCASHPSWLYSQWSTLLPITWSALSDQNLVSSSSYVSNTFKAWQVVIPKSDVLLVSWSLYAPYTPSASRYYIYSWSLANLIKTWSVSNSLFSPNIMLYSWISYYILFDNNWSSYYILLDDIPTPINQTNVIFSWWYYDGAVIQDTQYNLSSLTTKTVTYSITGDGHFTLNPYNTWRSTISGRQWLYCYYYWQLQWQNPWYNPIVLTGNEWDINSLLYWSWVNQYTLFNCPANYQASTLISLKIKNFPWLSILNNTILWEIDLIKPISCLIGAYNYWSNSWSIQMPTLSSMGISGIIDIVWLAPESWKIYETSQTDKSTFAKIFNLILVLPALYLAFKRVV